MKRLPGPHTLSEGDRRVLASWSADCAGRTLPLFEAHAPGDLRPRQALIGIRAFAHGLLSIGQLRALSVQAHAAARAATDPAAVAAARATGHAAAVAHMAAHALRAAAYAAKAVGLASPSVPTAAADEQHWQQQHATSIVAAVLQKLPTY